MAKQPTPAIPRATRLLRGPVPVIVLLACFVALGMSATNRKSVTFDESAHFDGGLGYWLANDYRMQPENGNWTQRWATLPAWLSGYRYPSFDDPTWKASYVWGNAERLFFGIGNDPEAMLRSGRAMIAAAGVLLGLLVYFWSRRLFGPVGGLLSLALYVFSPTMLSNSFLATSDTCAALFFTAAIAALWALLHRVTLPLLGVTCLSLAGLILSKYSGVLIVPMAVLLVGIRLLNPAPLPVTIRGLREVRGRWRQLGVFAATALVETAGVLLIIWASYGFRYATFAPQHAEGSEYQQSWADIEGRLTPTLRAIVDFSRAHELLPEAYLYGFTYTMFFAQMRNGFLRGEFGVRGWTSFFPTCLLLKTPLSLFMLLGLAGVSCWSRRGHDSTDNNSHVAARYWWRIYPVVPLFVLLGVYWYFALRSNLNIGHRHLLPTYPAMFILAGAAAGLAPRWLTAPATASGRAGPKGGRTASPAGATTKSKLSRAAGAVVIGAIAINAFEALWIWPNYLAYFNPLIGGPRYGYRWLIDSSLDWGQDLREFKTWLDDHPDLTSDRSRVYFSYFGTARPDYYEIQVQRLPCFFPLWRPHIPQPLTGGLYCLSASMLDAVYTMPFPGRWNVEYERSYNYYKDLVAKYLNLSADSTNAQQLLAEAGTPQMQESFRAYETLRLARLTSFLRTREPDDEVGYSILIYRLSDADVRRALEGPPCELLAESELKIPKEFANPSPAETPAEASPAPKP